MTWLLLGVVLGWLHMRWEVRRIRERRSAADAETQAMDAAYRMAPPPIGIKRSTALGRCTCGGSGQFARVCPVYEHRLAVMRRIARGRVARGQR